MSRINDTYDVGKAFAAIENELIASMMRNMARHRAEETREGIQWSMWQTEQLHSLEEYRRANTKKFGPQFEDINSKIAELLRQAHEDGRMEQEAEILDAIHKGYTARRVSDGVAAEFFRLNTRKLDALIDATTKDMQKAETAVLRMADDQYRKAIFNAQVYANTGAGTYEKAVDMATKDMLAAGLNCIEYKNGSRHTTQDYADMAIRTASKRAYLQGEGGMREEWGVYTVILNKRGNPCPKCLPFVGKVLIDDVWSNGPSDGISNVTGIRYPLMSAAIDAGLYHPRCKDVHTTYFEGISTPPSDSRYTKQELRELAEKYSQEQEQQYAQRQAEKYERLEQYSLDPENKRKYGARKNEWEEQAYRSVTRGESSEIIIDHKRDGFVTVQKVESYPGEIYVSEKAHIKPRDLHGINRRTEEAMKEWGIPLEKKPKIVIVSPDEMPTAYGKYDAVSNTVFYIPQITDERVTGMPIGYVEYHEMWHLKQAETFRKGHGEITLEDKPQYMEFTCERAKRKLDRLGIDGYNVDKISPYAKKTYDRQRYDEVEAEYAAVYRRKV